MIGAGTNSKEKIMISGGAGFIGFHLGKKLLERGYPVIAFDNMNPYYDVQLKEARLKLLKSHLNFTFVQAELADPFQMDRMFKKYSPDVFIHLAAQAGVRYSIENPQAYIDSNLLGFFNILECCRHYPLRHLLFASSSSVYGANKKVPYCTTDSVDHPISFYAATKKSNELMAYCYSKLYKIPATGLRFFTVYGPYGRPDMAYFSFTQKILSGETVKLFNHGDMYRDFTYIDDIVNGIEAIIPKAPLADENGVNYKIYNIGNNHPEKLLDFVTILEQCLGKKAQKEFLPMQPGDVYQTYADITDLANDFGFKPAISLKEGLKIFVEWYRQYYKGRRQ